MNDSGGVISEEQYLKLELFVGRSTSQYILVVYNYIFY